MTIPTDQLETCLAVLQRVADDPALIDEDERFKGLVAKIHRKGKKHKKATRRETLTREDVQTAHRAALVQGRPRALPDPTQSTEETYHRHRGCYVCKSPFAERHHFYHLLCPTCAELNWTKRHQRGDLTRRVALVIGGRTGSGFESALKFLRDGARVLVTTRFTQDAAKRFHDQRDHPDWWDRLDIHGLDLRDLPAAETFALRMDAELPHLDILVHNAAQTIKRPLEFYRSLLEGERDPTHRELVPLSTEPILMEARPGYQQTAPPMPDMFPVGAFDALGEQIDLRPETSWRTRLGDIGSVELVEVFLVNSIAPLLLTNHLLPTLKRSPHERRFVVNVSSMEGRFAKRDKSGFHPHTNMTKAALNMLTHTVAEQLGRDGIYVNSVDPGWFTDERPAPLAANARDRDGFHPPLDSVDAAARIYDPIVQGLVQAEPLSGCYLKDYEVRAW